MSFSHKLPSGITVMFREPRNADRAKVLSLIKPGDKVQVDEVLAAYCLEGIRLPNGASASMDPDPRYRMDPWTIKDSQTYVQLWLELFTLGEDEMKALREEAKKLLASESAPSMEEG